MTNDELRTKPINEVIDYLESSLRSLFSLKMKHCLKQLSNTSELKKSRREIAVVKTILHERRSKNVR